MLIQRKSESFMHEGLEAKFIFFQSRKFNEIRNQFFLNDKMYLILVLANASILTNRIFPIVRAERSFVTIFSIETVETIAPKVPVTKNGKFHVRFVHIKPNEQRNTYIYRNRGKI